jgi:hypothetical protein
VRIRLEGPKQSSQPRAPMLSLSFIKEKHILNYESESVFPGEMRTSSPSSSTTGFLTLIFDTCEAIVRIWVENTEEFDWTEEGARAGRRVVTAGLAMDCDTEVVE